MIVDYLLKMLTKRRMKKKGQIWIETVIYTLIAFVMIGLVLSFVKPKIEQVRDQAVIEQGLNMFEDINSIILGIRDVPGNQRLIELGIKKGVLEIRSAEDKIVYEVESKYTYSQPGEDVQYGDIIARTEKQGRTNIVTLTTEYEEDYNLTYRGNEETKSLTQAPTPYKIFISNEGNQGNKIVIDLEVL